MAFYHPTLGSRYTRAQIHDLLGGGLQEFLPTKNGRVVCACLRTDLNPHAPETVWVGAGSRREGTARTAVLQGESFPVFLRREDVAGEDSWEYVGWHRGVHYRTPGPELPGSVVGVLTLEPDALRPGEAWPEGSSGAGRAIPTLGEVAVLEIVEPETVGV